MSYSIFTKLDGSILLACVGDAILVYDALQGELVNKAMRGGIDSFI